MRKYPLCTSHDFWIFSSGQKRCKRCGLTRKKEKTFWKERLLEFFCLGVPAYRLRFQVPLNLKTIERWYRFMRGALYQYQIQELEALSGSAVSNERVHSDFFELGLKRQQYFCNGFHFTSQPLIVERRKELIP
jgi:transposase